MYYIIETNNTNEEDYYFWNPATDCRSWSKRSLIELCSSDLNWVSDFDVIAEIITTKLEIPELSLTEAQEYMISHYPELFI